MSRAYRISLKDSETRALKAGDEIGTQLEILDILPPEDMGDLLREELARRGFQDCEDGSMSRSDGTVTVIVDPCTGEITVRAQTEETVKQEAKREASGFHDVGPDEESLRGRVKEQLKQDLDRKFEQEQSRLQSEATQQLEKKLEEIQPEISEIVNKITRDALKKKAQQMGAVKEVTEDAESGSLTIKIEV